MIIYAQQKDMWEDHEWERMTMRDFEKMDSVYLPDGVTKENVGDFAKNSFAHDDHSFSTPWAYFRIYTDDARIHISHTVLNLDNNCPDCMDTLAAYNKHRESDDDNYPPTRTLTDEEYNTGVEKE